MLTFKASPLLCYKLAYYSDGDGGSDVSTYSGLGLGVEKLRSRHFDCCWLTGLAFVTLLSSASVGFVMLCRLLWWEATCTTMCGGTLFFCLQTEGGVGPLVNGIGAKLKNCPPAC
jgi:hypothetical protein